MNPQAFLIPSWEESDGNRRTISDVFSKLLKNRIINIFLPIGEFVSGVTIASLLLLDSEQKKPIKIYINSPGGDITAGLAILDTMNCIKSEVHTVCVGQCASMAAVLLSAGCKGHRTALPNSRILIHQPWASGLGGQASDIALQAEEILRMRTTLEGILANNTGQPLEKVHQDCDRDYIMSPAGAISYGIIDKVLGEK